MGVSLMDRYMQLLMERLIKASGLDECYYMA